MSDQHSAEHSSAHSFTVETAKVLAEVAHNRQKDKLKRPYREHVIAVGDALADFDDDIRIAGYLHDIAEDTPVTRQALLDMGVSERAVGIIERVTRRLHDNPDYLVSEDHRCAQDRLADGAVPPVVKVGPADATVGDLDYRFVGLRGSDVDPVQSQVVRPMGDNGSSCSGEGTRCHVLSVLRQQRSCHRRRR